uniref:Mitochondrial protein n=1 Tax=Lactuca sativa TaxID=4236 RepID=A0A9R1WRQ0_LACSA|nr:hypothetical protein LSAT_V11C900504820 [Lactuca sativa]
MNHALKQSLSQQFNYFWDFQRPPVSDPSQYIGRLLYLTITQLDVAYLINRLTAHHLLRFIKQNPGQAFSDSDWVGFIDTRRYVIGLCVFLGNSLISWKSKKQTIVSRSSNEAEYRAIVATTCELV